ncbi:MAG TPA: hypothetical protein VFD49_13415 [Candidatus Dormibacteraeota bacterium]|nr:hypothetical protein [Candidatus Dormibacteraeota bacterium]
MARKGKRRQAARARRTSPPGPRPPAAAPGAGAATRQQVGGDQTLVHAVEMSLAPSTRPAPRRGARLVLENADPAIPLDRVPHFASDLKRVGVVMLIMVALLVAGAELVIPRLLA